jgi:hypothetical protein
MGRSGDGFSVIFLPLVASAHAQTPTISAARSTVVENDFSTRLSVTGTGARHHRVASSPLLPWPRPAELARAAAVPNQDQAELAHTSTPPKRKLGDIGRNAPCLMFAEQLAE